MSVLLMLVLISLLILVHELGHYWVARRCGVRVERFGFGLPFGPTLWKKRVGDTELCLHPLLFGGYVSFPDDNPDSPIPKDSPERFENRPLLQRAAIALAGIAVNAVVGWALMAFVLGTWGLPLAKVTITQAISAEAPAAKAGLRGPAIVEAVNGVPVQGEMMEQRMRFVTETIKHAGNRPVTLLLQPVQLPPELKKGAPPPKAKDIAPPKPVGDPYALTVTPKNGMIGVALGVFYENQTLNGPLDAIATSARYLSNVVVMNFQALGKMLMGQADARQLSGPISIVNVGAQLIDYGGIQQGLMLTAIISVILAVMNLLPIPALDGGHLLFIGLEAIQGRPVNRALQERVIQAGFLGLLLLMGFILWNDINNTWINPVLPR